MKIAKKSKHKEAHTSRSKIGMGDFYGTGVKQKMGRMRDVSENMVVPKAKLKKPPRSLA